ncbi:helix-turn-helix transcriptional regulator [Ligilactobacillus sp. WILCCON 0076]|uniref:Helix-turn-helix transcriptional regulator n=1 Tax=Ligilactobacillus ubinensis TaxID=2876789 RepID=A0A9X2FMD2_9LACO|nr:helix-turn-helix domain-containing protein [Ligilactobacillus ubinensis]MCP0887799.1 helix-turn-helix transcriptional regulator [Ligilactobacillus ubinensis]
MSIEVQMTPDFKLCPKFEKTFSILGKKWNGLIIEVLLNEGPQRFKDLAAKVDKCSDRVLVERLKELENDGLLERVPQTDSCRILYELTEQGEDLRNIMDAIHSWAEKWYSLKDCQ